MRRSWILPVGAALLSLLFSPAREALAQLKMYYTTSAAAKRQMPRPNDGVWNEVNAADQFTITLRPGDKLWIACQNRRDDDLNKHFKIRLEGARIADLALDARRGVNGYQTPDNTRPVRKAFVSVLLAGHVREWYFIFSPQPLWECVEFTPFLGVNNATFTVRADSVCSNLIREHIDLSARRTSFGAPRAMNGAPLYREVWIFPRETMVDPDATLHSLIGPAGSGLWQPEPILHDPHGELRPLGGVRWTPAPISDPPPEGLGLRPGEEFDLRLHMRPDNADGTGGASRMYDLFGIYTDGDNLGIASVVLDTEPELQDPLPPCPGDFNGDGVLDSLDFFNFLSAFFDATVDLDGDGVTTSTDFFEFLARFLAGCDPAA